MAPCVQPTAPFRKRAHFFGPGAGVLLSLWQPDRSSCGRISERAGLEGRLATRPFLSIKLKRILGLFLPGKERDFKSKSLRIALIRVTEDKCLGSTTRPAGLLLACRRNFFPIEYLNGPT